MPPSGDVSWLWQNNKSTNTSFKYYFTYIILNSFEVFTIDQNYEKQQAVPHQQKRIHKQKDM